MRKKFSQRKFEIRAQEILARLRAEVRPFGGSDEEKRSRIERARRDKLYFFKTYLPHYFDKEFADFHRELLALSEVRDEPVFIAAPREHAKSTIITLGVPLHDILFERRHFILIISDTEDLAGDFCQFIQLELEENERIREDFGDLVNAGFWEAKDFVTKNGIRVKARGRGQRIRGLRWRQYRPDRVLIDDLENDKNVKNPRIVNETIEWLLTAVLGSLSENYSMMMVGTILSKRCVLKQMIDMKSEDDPESPRFISRIYRAITDDGTPLWPAQWSLERLLKRKAQMGSIRFNQEMQNDPKDDEGLFREEWIRYYHPEELTNRPLRVYTYIDPSMEPGSANDYKAIITVGIDSSGIIYVLDAFIRKCSVDTMVRATYSRYEEWHPLVIGLEENALGEFAGVPFRMVAQEKGYHLPLKGLKQKVAKEARIGRISPLVERGIIRFRKGHSDQDLLVEQLIYFPSSTINDDGPDALEGAISLIGSFSQQIEFRTTGVRRDYMDAVIHHVM